MNIDNIRKDFPIYNTEKPPIYLDNACMTFKPVQVIKAVNSYYNDFPACGGRSLHKLGKKVTEEVEKSRKTIKKFFNSKQEKEIVFSKNTTESLNLVINSLDFKKEDKVLTTDKEHNSNLLPILKKGVKHEIVKSNEDNTFNLRRFEEQIDKNVKLVSMVHTSNLDGYTIPAKEIIKIAHDRGALVMLDAAQSAPHKEIDVKKLDVDFLACSSHKMLGPSLGILYGKYHLLNKLKPFLVGGDTVFDSTYTSFNLEKPPEKFEAGLQDYAAIIGCGEALSYLMKIGLKNIEKHEVKLNEKITKGIKEIARIIGPEAKSRSSIISFNLKNLDPHNIAMILDESANVMIRSGAHCVHSWFNAHNLKGSARASLYLYNTGEECDIFIENLKRIAKLLG